MKDALPSAAGLEGLALEAHQLPAGKLSLGQTLVLAIVGLQVGPNMAIVGGGLFLFIGYGSWLSIVIAYVLMIGVCEGVRLVAHANPDAKGLMPIVAASLGDNAALFVRTSLIIGYVAAAAACVASVVIFASSLLSDFGWTWGVATSGQMILILLGSVASCAIAYRGLEASLKTAMILGLGCFPIVIVLVGLSLYLHDFDFGRQFALDSSVMPNVLQGAVILVAGIIGIDGIAALADETEEPARNVSRIVYGAFGLSALGLLAASIAETPIMAASIDAIQQGLSPTAVLASTAGVPALAPLVDFFLLLGSFAAHVTVITYGSRLFADASSAGLLPTIFARVHPRFSSYHVSVTMLGVVQAFVPTAAVIFFAAPPLLSSMYISVSAAFLWAIPHALICVGGIRVAVKARSNNVLSYLTMAISIAGFFAMLMISLTRPGGDWQSLLSRVCLGTTALLFLYFWMMQRRTKRQEQIILP